MNNYSKQREIILETFKYLNHPTAEQIYDKECEVTDTNGRD